MIRRKGINGVASFASDDRAIRELALFAGAGGGILGGKLLGWRTVCAVERDAYAAGVLVARQNDGYLDPFPIWDDVRTFDGRTWRGRIDVVSGGFPCQDISSARGGKRAGLAGDKSGLWRHMLRIIGESAPALVFAENSPMLRTNGLRTILNELAALGYHAAWGVYSAADVGARHERERLWIVGANRHANRQLLNPQRAIPKRNAEPLRAMQGRWWSANERMVGASDGVANWVDRRRAIGNGQVPAVAAMAWSQLSAQLANVIEVS